MSKMEELKKFFEDWKREFNIFDSDFYPDGIINESLYDSCKPGHRILVIAKEPNASNHDQNGDRSFITEWDNKKAEYPFACRISEWVYGILHDFPAYDLMKGQTLEYLRHISFMNVKKSGGKGFADRENIYEMVSKHKEYIIKEINIINPDIIILGLSFDEELIRQIFGRLEWRPSGYSINIAKFGDSKVINFYHPSARNAAPASYSLMQNVIRSDAFRNL
jgi:hypothetical protein